MVFAVRDYFESNIFTPLSNRPALGHPLYDYIVGRLLDSFGLPWGPYAYLPLMQASLGRASEVSVTDQWPKIRSDLDSGQLVCLGLNTVYSLWPGDIGKNHQVLAYGYELSGDDVSLNVYDPNSSRSDTVTIGFKLSSPREPITSNVYLTEGLQVRGFFRLPYSLASPPLIDDAELEAFSPPTVVASRSKFSISVTARNIGSTTWNAAGPTAYRLGSQLPQDNSTWGVQRAELTKDVAPRQMAVFDVAVTAPDLVGPVEMGWRMVHELVRWFGQTVQASVSVGEPEKCISIRACIAG